MITCKECKHWDVFGGTGPLCGDKRFGECSSDKFVDYDGMDFDEPADCLVLRCSDGDCWLSTIIATGQGFGCIHGKRKETRKDVKKKTKE